MNKSLYHVLRSARLNSKILRILRARTHNTVILALIACSVCAALTFFVLPIQNKLASQIVFLAVCALCFLYSASYTATRYTDFPQLSAHLSLGWTCGIVLLLIYFSGGVPVSDASPLITAPICMAFCFLGFRSGLIWSSIATAAFISMGVFWYNGGKFPDLIQTQYEQYTQAAIWVLCMVFVTIILACYEWMLQRTAEHRGVGIALSHNELIDKESFYSILTEAINRADHHEEQLLLVTITSHNIDPDTLLKQCRQWLRTSDSVMRTSSHTCSLLIERIKDKKNADFISQRIQRELQHLSSAIIAPETTTIKAANYPENTETAEAMLELTHPHQGDGKFSMYRKGLS